MAPEFWILASTCGWGRGQIFPIGGYRHPVNCRTFNNYAFRTTYCVISVLLDFLKDFEIHLRGTVLELFWTKWYHLKCKNLIYKNDYDLTSKDNFFCSNNCAEISFLHHWFLHWAQHISATYFLLICISVRNQLWTIHVL